MALSAIPTNWVHTWLKSLHTWLAEVKVAVDAAAPAASAMTTDTVQTVTGEKTFQATKLKFFNAGNTFAGLLATTATAARTYTFPDAAIAVAGLDLAQLWTAIQTLGHQLLKINNAGATFAHRLGSLATANRDVNLPDAAGTVLLQEQVGAITLTPAAEAGNAIVVTGQLVDLKGNNLSSSLAVLVETSAPTAIKGQITTTVGTEVMNTGAPLGKQSAAVITATGAGAFAFSVADDAAEPVLVRASVNGAVVAHALITFA